MSLPEAFGVAQAAALYYNPHARFTGQPVWSEDHEEAAAWWKDPIPLQALLTGLSTRPRPVAEEVLLQELVDSLVTGKLPHAADPITQKALIHADLAEILGLLCRSLNPAPSLTG